jgi:hypothetical protein
MADQIIAPVLTVKLSAELLEKARGISGVASKMADVDQAFGVIVEETASAVARVMGTEPTFDFWNQVSYEFRRAYQEKRKCASKTADNRWSDVTKYMEEKFGLAKPKAPTQAADKKAKQRAAQEKKVKAAKAQCVKPADAFQKAEELLAVGKVDEAKVYQAAAVELGKDLADNAKKQMGEKLKKAKELLRDTMAKCDDYDRLMAALEVLKYGKDVVKAANAEKKPAAPRKVKGDKVSA